MRGHRPRLQRKVGSELLCCAKRHRHINAGSAELLRVSVLRFEAPLILRRFIKTIDDQNLKGTSRGLQLESQLLHDLWPYRNRIGADLEGAHVQRDLRNVVKSQQ